MLNFLFNLLKPEFCTNNSKEILYSIEWVLAHLHENFVKDKDSKNIAIDVICQYLQSKKELVEPSESSVESKVESINAGSQE